MRKDVIKMADKLTPKQESFCEMYVENGYKAIIAYKEVYGCTDNSAATSAYRLLKKQEIIDRIHEIQKDVLSRKCITAERVLDALAEIAFEDTQPNKDKLQALNLIQKQLGLQQQNIKADVDNRVVIDVKVGD